MKKVFLTISFLFLATSVYAATATPSATPGDQKKLDNLKDRLASAATQLKQSQKRAIAGTVKSTSVSTIVVEMKTSDIKIELTDGIQVAQVIKGKRTDIATDDLAKGDFVVVFGEYDTTLDLMKAKVIFIQENIPERLTGVVTAVDKKNFTITVETPEKQLMIVDIETTTKNLIWDKINGSGKGAFSKYAVGDTVAVLETPNPKVANRVNAIRILDIGNLTGATPIPTPVPTKIASPSATVKVTPKPTVKPTATPIPTP